MEEMILFHGSKSGIKGEISPCSRTDCDFGRAFYMGEDELQAAGLVQHYKNAAVYTLRVNMPDDNRILKLNEKEWLYTVLSHRGTDSDFDSLSIVDNYRTLVNKYDLVIGKIADDRMQEAIALFTGYAMTDVCLYACLKRVQYGNQFAAKTANMCRRIAILEEKTVNEKNFPGLQEYMARQRTEAVNTIQEEMRLHQRDGRFLYEILEDYCAKKENAINDER